MEVDSYLQDRLVHEYWTQPAENWLEYFMSYEKFESILENAAENKELLGKLATQFAEQAASTEAEQEALQTKNFPIEDVQYYQRKSACLWLCSMASFSAIQWNFYYLLENFDILTVKPLIDYTKRIFTDSELTSDATFGNWLWDKFCHAIQMKNRVPTPVPKPTVNNPFIKSSPDQTLLRYEANQRVVIELQTFTAKCIQNFEEYAKEGSSIYVPGWHCFYDPFKEGAAKALNIGILGEDVLVPGPPKPQLSLQVDLISAVEVANKARFDLAEYYFDEDAQLQNCVERINQVDTIGTHPLTVINSTEITGYKVALGIVNPPKEQIHPDQVLDDDAPHRKFDISRLRQLAEVEDSKKKMFHAANLACDLIQQQPILIRQLLNDSNSHLLIEALHKRMAKIKDDTHRRRIFSLLHYFCATVYGFKQLLEKGGFPPEWLRNMVTALPSVKVQHIQKNIIPALLSGNAHNAYWTMLTSFTVTEITRAVEALIQNPIIRNVNFKVPARFRFSELLSEFIGIPTRAVVDLNAVLIGKACQLSRLQNYAEWEQYCNQLPAVFALPPNNPERFGGNIILEAMHVKNAMYNRKLHWNWDRLELQQYNVQLSTVKRLFSVPCLMFPNVTREVLAFCLNTKEFEYVCKIDMNYFLITISKLLAAFGIRGNNLEGMADFVKVWFDTVKSFFTRQSSGSRRDPQEALKSREIIKQRTEFITFIRLIKEPSLVIFLISFFAHMFNSVISDKKAQLKLFVQQSALFPTDFELPNANTEAIMECLTEVLKAGLESNPVNAFWIRTAADFEYAKGEVEEAATLYMETILACAPGCQAPFPDNVIDDTMWSRLRVCLNRMNQHTMAALVCQLMKSRRLEEYSKVASILANNTSLDPGPECFPMLFDISLAEELSIVYDNSKQFNSLARLQNWSAKQSLNPSNRAEIIGREQGRRIEHLLRCVAANVFEIHL